MKRLILIILVLGLYTGSLLIKNKLRLAHNAETPPTMGQLRAEKGIPVYAKTIKKTNFNQMIKVSGFVNENGLLKSEITRDVVSRLSTSNNAYLEYKDKTYKGRIKLLSKKANLYTGLYLIEIQFESVPVETIGRISVANIQYKSIQDVIVVDRSSVSQRDETPYVYLVNKEKKIVKRKIKIADSNDDEYLVSFGVQEGDIIITSDFRDLGENDFVFIANKEEM